uniref:FHA domain-containing protein n=1 Tax=Auxenochlorella protothecoides TaxID=3075 RepID=A0A1D2AAS5_AUXPR
MADEAAQNPSGGTPQTRAKTLPPRFSEDAGPAPAPAPSTRTELIAASAAALQAARHSTPGQKERLMEEAASKVLHGLQERKAAAQARPGEAPPAAEYTPPQWSGPPPPGMEYGMEVMRGGALLTQLDLKDKAYYTFGRTPNNDITLEHPTSSRLHAVLQYRGSDGAAFMYDPGSTHGTFINKVRLENKKHAPLRVGDIVRFGQSSRLYLFTGPAELLPEEGPSRDQRMQLKALEAMAARKEREAAIAKAQMESAIGGGASWGFSEDAVEDTENLEALDWRAHAANRGLSDKQQKLATKIRKLELRCATLQTESERIKAKQGSMEELSAGQATTLLRNEQEVDRATAEMEEMEETLLESLRDSIRSKAAAAAGGGEAAQKKRRRRDPDDDDDDQEWSGKEDGFMYDRTQGTRKSRAKAARGARSGPQAADAALDAASLLARKALLEQERTALQERLDLARRDEASRAAGGAGVVATIEALPESAEAAPASGSSEAVVDSLDAFMTEVGSRLESEKVEVLMRQLAEVEEQLDQTQKLIHIADPEGYFASGSVAAQSAIAKATQRLLDEEAQQKEREQSKEAQQAAPLPPGAKEGGVDPGAAPNAQPPAALAVQDPAPTPPSSSIHSLAGTEEGPRGGLELRKGPAHTASSARAAAMGRAAQEVRPSGQGPTLTITPNPPSSFEARRAGIAAHLASLADSKREKSLREGVEAAKPEGAAARLAADLDALRAARRRTAGDAGDEEAEWKPPSGQVGDGRVALNDTLGY